MHSFAQKWPTRFLILGHSFIHRKHKFLVAYFDNEFVKNFYLSTWRPSLNMARDRGKDRLITLEDLEVMSLADDFVILQGKDLSQLLYKSYGVRHPECVFQTNYRKTPLL